MIKSDPRDFQLPQQELFGIYRGVVEDNNHPDKDGRCRIRVLGIHTHIKEETPNHGVPIEHLVWAEPVLPIHQGSVSWYGDWQIPLKGSWVWVFFENGNILAPRYFGSAPGVPLKGPQGIGATVEGGFWDPDEIHPENPCIYDGPSNGISKLEEPDLHRLARENEADTYVPYVDDARIKGIEIAEVCGGGGAWDEFDPFWRYGSKYPWNHVQMWPGQISIEVDSTPNSSRFSLVHWKSLSRIEIWEDGRMIIKNRGYDRQDLVEGGNRLEWTEKNINETSALGSKNTKVAISYRVQAGESVEISAPDIYLLGNVYIQSLKIGSGCDSDGDGFAKVDVNGVTVWAPI